MAKLITLRDNFNDNVTDTSLWSDASGVVETGGRTVITPSTSTPYRVSVSNYDGTDSEIVAAVPVVTATGTTGSLDCGLVVRSGAGSDRIAIHKLGAFLGGSKVIGGVQTELFGTGGAYSTTTYRWWRIREAAGTVYLEVAAASAPTVWTTLYSGATPFLFGSVYAYVYATFTGTEASPGTFEIDTINPLLLQDIAGNAMIPFTGTAVTNATTITISASDVGSGADAGLVVTTGVGLRDLAGNLMVPFSGMAVTNAGSATVSASDVGAAVDAVSAQSRGQADTASGTDSGTGATTGVGLRDLAGNLMVPFSGMAVTNNTSTAVVPITATDAAAGLDAAPAQGRSTADNGGTGIAPLVYDAPIPYDSSIPYDSGVIPGSGETASAVVAVSAADTGGGVEGSSAQSRAQSDAGAGLDAAGSIALARAETAAGVEVATVGVAGSDAGSASEAAGAIGITTSELAAGADVAGDQLRSAVDAGGATESATAASGITATDAGVGLDGVSSLSITSAGTISGTDAATGIESGALSASLSRAESASAVESASVVISGLGVTDLSASDAGAALETASVSAALAVDEAGTGSDAAGTIGMGGADAGGGTDAGQVVAAMTGTDAGAGVDVAMAIGLGDGETAVAVDQFPVVNVPLAGSDSAGAAETGFVSVSAAETGTADDAGTIGVRAFETAVAVDQFPGLLASITTTQLAVAADAVALAALAVTLSDAEHALALDSGGHSFDPPSVSLRSVVARPRIVSVAEREMETV